MLKRHNVLKIISFLFFCYESIGFCYSQSQIKGRVSDNSSKAPLIGVSIVLDQKGTVTNENGEFSMHVPDNHSGIMKINYTGYTNQTILLDGRDYYEISLQESSILLQTTVISASRFETPIEQSPISLSLLKSKDVERLSTNSIKQVLDRVPGVQILDGQANIRGGSGYSYGAGSRVMLVMDDIPILQADAGFPNWDDLPLENVGQIEVVKGAASALYGSAAMNGIIHFRSKQASVKPVTTLSIIPKYYFKPIGDDYWWKNKSFKESPKEIVVSLTDLRKIKSWNFSSGIVFNDRLESNQDVHKKNWRVNTNVSKLINKNWLAGLGLNANKGESSDYFYWRKSGSLSGDTSSYSYSDKIRISIDPSVQYISNSNYKHKILSRFYYIDNKNDGNQSNKSNNYYGEYQFSKKIEKINLSIATGLYYSASYINAPLYGDSTLSSNNRAAYLQLEKKLASRWILTGGLRYESFTINGPSKIGNKIIDKKSNESRPVFRAGLNYKANAAGNFRASWGQGFRFPTLAEKYIQTKAGGLVIAPNPDLKSEYGSSYEIGYRQGFKLAGLTGLWDIAGFYSEYKDMMEFGLLFEGFSAKFQSRNIGDTKIPGAETSILLNRQFGNNKISLQTNYTYINPKFKAWDITGKDLPRNGLDNASEGQLNALNSTADFNILKYRSKHLFRVDLEYEYKAWTIAYDFNYASQVDAIDPLFDIFIPGVKEYRSKYNNGNRIHGCRLAYTKKKYTLQANVFNLSNQAYTNRPAYLEPVRNLVLRLKYEI